MATKKLGIDLGNFGIKVYSDFMKPFMFEARTKEYEEDEYSMGGVNVLSYEDKEIILGEGDFEHENRKVKRSDIRDCFVGALAQCCENKDEVIVGVGLPADQHMIDKEALLEVLSFKGDKITFTYGDPKRDKLVQKTVYIKSITVFPESLAAYWALADELSKVRTTEIIMTDIGGRTTDLCNIERLLNGSVRPSSPKTETLGTLKAYEKMADYFTKLSRERDIDYAFNTEMMEAYVEKGLDLGEMFDFIDKDAFVKLCYKKIADKIVKFIKKSNPEYGKAMIVIVGGGASKIGPYVKEKLPNCMIFEDIYSNAKGYFEGVKQLTADEE